MSPLLLVSILLAGLLALLPVWRLRVAGWSPRWLFAAWATLAVTTFLVVRFPGGARFLLPLLVLAYVAPFVAGPERLTRVLGDRRDGGGGGVIIDVTPRLRIQPPDDDADGGDADTEPDRAGGSREDPGDNAPDHRPPGA